MLAQLPRATAACLFASRGAFQRNALLPSPDCPPNPTTQSPEIRPPAGKSMLRLRLRASRLCQSRTSRNPLRFNPHSATASAPVQSNRIFSLPAAVLAPRRPSNSVRRLRQAKNPLHCAPSNRDQGAGESANRAAPCGQGRIDFPVHPGFAWVAECGHSTFGRYALQDYGWHCFGRADASISINSVSQ